MCITIVGGNCISAVSIMKTSEECGKFSVLAELVEIIAGRPPAMHTLKFLDSNAAFRAWFTGLSRASGLSLGVYGEVHMEHAKSLSPVHGGSRCVA